MKTVLPLLAALLLALPAGAAEKGKAVHVGWYESSYNSTDQNGRRSGYAYEYQLKLSAYTGWNLEYVTGSWPELMQKLMNGDIDLMSDVSHTPEREAYMLFPDLPMGTEEYYIFTAPGNTEITPGMPATLNGKKVGANKSSLQLELTDAEIFDAETARHFTEDDRMALSMDHPYVFFEDVPDAAGNQRQFQTTKLKYIDDTGRLCLLACARILPIRCACSGRTFPPKKPMKRHETPAWFIPASPRPWPGAIPTCSM